MKFKSTYKFQLSEVIAPIKVFYLTIFLIELLIIITSTIFNSGGSMKGLDSFSAVFLFILSLFVFKKSFHYLSSNNISRKTQVLSFFAVILTIAGIMLAVDVINASILFLGDFFNEKYCTSLDVMYFIKTVTYYNVGQYHASGSYTDYSNILVNLATTGEKVVRIFFNIAFNFVSYIFAMIFGYLISVIFYRLSPKIKIIIAVGIFAFFTMGSPFLFRISQRENNTFLNNFGDFIVKNIMKNATGSIITELIFIVIFGLISYRVAIRASLNAK